MKLLCQLILAWNMHAICHVHVVFVITVWSLFGPSLTTDIDQLKQDMEEAKKQIQQLNEELGKFFSCI